MKKLSMLVATFALAIPAPLALPAPAMAKDNGNSAFCQVAAAAYGYSSIGECNSLMTTQNHLNDNGTAQGGFAAQICSFEATNYPQDFANAYASYTDCVHDGASAYINSGGPF